MAEWFHFTNMASGVLYAGLGAFALTVRPRRLAVLAFGLHGIAFGAAFLWFNAYEILTGARPFVSQAVMLGIAYAALFAVIMYSVSERSWLWGPALGALGAGLASQLVFYVLFSSDLDPVDTVLNLSYGISNAAIFLGAWALLSRRGRPSVQDVRLVLVAFLLFHAVADGMRLVWLFRSMSDPSLAAVGVSWRSGEEFWWNAVLWAAWCLLFVLAALREQDPADRRPAWRFAWLVMAFLVVGAALMLPYEHHPGTHPLRGILRTLGFLILAYAILRGSLLGIDVKVRWTISKSTLAAIFVAVFFVASEAAQQFFGDRFESGYLGILAAGALVFAIAPLSRVADRMAEMAVPRTMTTPLAADTEREQMYRSAVRLALRDHALTRSEERELFRLARGLGLGSDRAHEILVELEGPDDSSTR